MSNYRKSHKGFTLVEIMASVILLVLAAIAFFSVFIYTAKLRVYASNDFRMSANASSWLEKVKSGSTVEYNDPNFIAQTDIDLNAGASILQEDYTNDWIIADEGNVDIQSPGGVSYTTENNINLGSGANFKKTTVTVKWDEKA